MKTRTLRLAAGPRRGDRVAAAVAAALLAPCLLLGPARADESHTPNVGINGVLSGEERPSTLLDAVRMIWSRPMSEADRAELEQRWARIAERAARLAEARSTIDASDPRHAALQEALDRLAQVRTSHSGTLRGRNGALPNTDGSRIAARNFERTDRMVREWAAAGEPLTIERLKDMNRSLGEGLANNGRQPGTIRGAGFNLTAGGDPKRAYIRGEHVAGAMTEFMEWYDRSLARGVNPVALAGQVYQRLVTIHPFPDGNGRTSRMAMDFVLRSHGLPAAAIRQGEHLVGLFGHSLVNEGRMPTDRPAGMTERATTNGVEDALTQLERALNLDANGTATARPARIDADVKEKIRAAARGLFPNVHWMAGENIAVGVSENAEPRIDARLVRGAVAIEVSRGMLAELDRAAEGLSAEKAGRLRSRALVLGAIAALDGATSMTLDVEKAARRAGVFGQNGLSSNERARLRELYSRRGLTFPEQVERRIAERSRPPRPGEGLVGEQAPRRMRDRMRRGRARR